MTKHSLPGVASLVARHEGEDFSNARVRLLQNGNGKNGIQKNENCDMQQDKA